MKILYYLITLSYLLCNYCCAQPEEINGKVIGVIDGDTINILYGSNEQKRIRLFGIDCPEKNQDFGNNAKQCTSDLIFGKEVRIIVEDIDKYGRLVGLIYLNNNCINEEIINQGFAWVYRYYCNKTICVDWIKLEELAQKNKKGLWSHENPIPPWEFRHGKTKTNSNNYKIVKNIIVLHGNVNSNIFHNNSCKQYECLNCTVHFNIREDAIKAGYKPCKICNP